MISSIANGLRLRKRQIPDHLKQKIRLHHGSVLDLAEDVQGMMFFLSPKMKWDGPLASKFMKLTGGVIQDQARLAIHNPKPGQVYDFPGFGSGFEKLYIGIIAEWDDGVFFEERELVSCYKGCVEHAKAHSIQTIAFPALGKDKRDFPHIKFARLALTGIFKTLDDSLQKIVISCDDGHMMDIYAKKLEDL